MNRKQFRGAEKFLQFIFDVEFLFELNNLPFRYFVVSCDIGLLCAFLINGAHLERYAESTTLDNDLLCTNCTRCENADVMS